MDRPSKLILGVTPEINRAGKWMLSIDRICQYTHLTLQKDIAAAPMQRKRSQSLYDSSQANSFSFGRIFPMGNSE